MFCYKEQHLSHLRAHPEEQLAQWLDAHAAGLDAQLDLSIQLVRAGFRIQQRTARIALYAMAMEQLSVSEQFATLLHELRGEDVHHLDVEEDDIPQMAWIGAKSEAEDQPQRQCPFDYCALLCMSRQSLEAIDSLLKEGAHRTKHRENQAILEQLQEREDNIRKEIGRLLEAADPHACADFHLGTESAFDLHASNYFDKPNPHFFSARMIDEDKGGPVDSGRTQR